MKFLSLLISIFVCYAQLEECVCIRRFFRGRFIKENLGEKLGKLEGLPPDLWLKQKLDHFNDADLRTWKQRYFINDAYFKPGGPVFLMIGGEGEQNPIWMVKGAWVEFAKSFGALLVSLEHRFYGKSHPTEDMSVKNLAYLSSEQALEDLAYFIDFIKEEMKLKGNKWVAFGGSYPGSLSAWFRMKYPHLVVGAVASSAPMFAKINFKEYMGVVRDSLDTTGPDCTSNIKAGIEDLELLMRHQVGWRTITKQFRLCEPLDGRSKWDVASFFESLAGNFDGVVQYNKDNRDFDGAKATNITINVVCDIMNDKSRTPMDRLAEVNNVLLDAYGEKCFEYSYNALLKDLQKVDWNSSASAGGRQWTYQTCTEFGWFQSSDLTDQPFGHYFPVELSLKMCVDIFGKQFTKELLEAGIKRTNTNYGGYGIQVSRIVFANGSIDPWHALSILHDLSSSATAVFINGTAHCANVYPSSPSDPPQLVKARHEIKQAIASWI